MLLLKTGDSNRFIRDNAVKALVAMVEYTSPARAMAAVIAHGTQLVMSTFFIVALAV